MVLKESVMIHLAAFRKLSVRCFKSLTDGFWSSFLSVGLEMLRRQQLLQLYAVLTASAEAKKMLLLTWPEKCCSTWTWQSPGSTPSPGPGTATVRVGRQVGVLGPAGIEDTAGAGKNHQNHQEHHKLQSNQMLGSSW